MKLGIKILKYLGVTVLFAALAVYWDLNTKVLVHNVSTQSLTEVTISLVEGGEIADVVLWKGSIEPGDAKGYWGIAPDDGSLIVSVTTADTTAQVDLGYVSGPITTNAYLKVSSKNDIKVTEVPPLWHVALAGVWFLLKPVEWLLQAVAVLAS